MWQTDILRKTRDDICNVYYPLDLLLKLVKVRFTVTRLLENMFYRAYDSLETSDASI